MGKEQKSNKETKKQPAMTAKEKKAAKKGEEERKEPHRRISRPAPHLFAENLRVGGYPAGR